MPEKLFVEFAYPFLKKHYLSSNRALMKITRLFGFSLVSVLIAAACKKKVADTSNLLNEADNNFIKYARIENFSEAETAKKALLKSADSVVLSFANQLLSEHLRAQSDLQIMGRIVGFTATDTTDVDHMAALSQLDSLTGRAFDSTYIRTRLAGHQAAINAYAAETKNGNQLNVRSYANANLQNIQIDYQRADSIATAFY